jgi:hypothetical protein
MRKPAGSVNVFHWVADSGHPSTRSFYGEKFCDQFTTVLAKTY